MKIALCQIDTTIGDVAGNARLITEWSRRAERAGADLAVFPEQALGGYPALDLWQRPGFVLAAQRTLKSLARQSGKMGILLGAPVPNPGKNGRPVLNAAVLLHKGKIAAVRAKTLLPTYDVFDETRYFEPARINPPISFLGRKIGVSVCEDAWAPAPGEGRPYRENPLNRQVRQGAELLVNISASPFERDKTRARRKILSAQARRVKKPLLYCNLVGGNDELIFDGGSMALNARGRLLAQAGFFEQDMLLVDPFAPTAKSAALSARTDEGDSISSVAAALRLGIQDYAAKCGLKKALLGLSGGIDSAVVCALAVRALGKANVTAVAMPSMYSSAQSLTDAKGLAANLGIRLLEIPIQEIFGAYLKTVGRALGHKLSDLAEQNIQARVRGGLLMALANQDNALLLATGNKSELAAGYCTLYGDMCGGLGVLADATKKTVYELARWLNKDKTVIPQSSIDKAPSAELKFNQKDQDDLPPYDQLDAILTGYIEDRREPDAIARRGLSRDLVLDVLGRIDRAEHKRRQAPPGLRISKKAFGIGRRMPVARGDYRKAA
ncbi:MAG TPA: NAD+ synthase [Elusimicrobiota bacterium]|nr:NAD+ synthase [Elusimicrobiota bacterium]